jgi:competence protein ComEC
MPEQRSRGTGGEAGAALVGAVLGPALQLQQASLSPVAAYALCVGGAAVVLLLAFKALARRREAVRGMLVLLAVAAAAFGVTGLRAAAYQAHALDPALEGRDVQVTGVVAAMPQRNELGLRFRLEVESARTDAGVVQLPPRLILGWYADAGPPPDLRAGERWQMTLRLKAPHGNLNPDGFDYELWLWEQGLQATGYVRAGPRDAPAQRVGTSGWHPVEHLRQHVRDAIYRRIEDRRVAGVLAALVVGDQSAIERADWDVFRATGVAHLMSISGLHITICAPS